MSDPREPITNDVPACARTQASEGLFRSIVEAQTDFVARFLPDGTLTYCNPAIGAAFGVPPHVFIGKSWYSHATDQTQLDVALASISRLSKDTPVVWNENSIRLPDGRVRWLEWENRALFDEKGEIVEIQAVGRDITARYQAEEALKESQATLRSFFEGSQLFMAVIELRGDKLYGVRANPAVSRYLSLATAEVANVEAADIGVPLGIAGLWADKCRRARAEHQPVRFVYERPISQAVRCLDVTVTYIGESTLGSRFSMVASDQTAQAQADYLRVFTDQLLAHTHDAVLTTNRDYKIVQWNLGAEQVFGWTKEDAVGRDFEALLKIRGSSRPADLRGSQFAGELECDKKDGGIAFVEARGVSMRDSNGALLSLVIVARDISQRKRTEQALKESEERLSTIFREAHAAIAIIDLYNGEVVDANPAFSELLGWPRKEVIDHTPVSLGLWVDLTQRDELRLKMLGGVRLAEVALRKKSGEIVVCLVSMNRTNIDRRPCLIAVVQDISELRGAEQKLRIAVQERDTLLREIHHRVKNNLQVLGSLIRLQLQKRPEPTAEEIGRSLLERIQAMSVVHEQLYSHERLDTVSADSYLADLSRAVLETHPDVMKRLSIDIEVEPFEVSIEVAMRLGLIIGELVTNALKHAFPGDREGELKIHMRREGRGSVLEVIDDGIGLPDGIDSQRSRSMGLELARQLATQLGADLELESGAGTRWTLRMTEV